MEYRVSDGQESEFFSATAPMQAAIMFLDGYGLNGPVELSTFAVDVYTTDGENSNVGRFYADDLGAQVVGMEIVCR